MNICDGASYLTKKEVEKVKAGILAQIAKGYTWQETKIMTLNHIFYWRSREVNNLMDQITKAVTFDLDGSIREETFSRKLVQA